jgi:hypothetical protein
MRNRHLLSPARRRGHFDGERATSVWYLRHHRRVERELIRDLGQARVKAGSHVKELRV